MKKLLALALVAMMLVTMTMTFALAEDKTTIVYDDKLTVNVVYPEGYENESMVEGVYLIVTMMQDGTPKMAMMICPDDEYADLVRLNDLTAEDLEAYTISLTEGYHDASTTILETEAGTMIVLVQENNADYSFTELITVYHGYVIDVMLGGDEVTEEDIATAMKFLSDMDFVEIAE